MYVISVFVAWRYLSGNTVPQPPPPPCGASFGPQAGGRGWDRVCGGSLEEAIKRRKETRETRRGLLPLETWSRKWWLEESFCDGGREQEGESNHNLKGAGVENCYLPENESASTFVLLVYLLCPLGLEGCGI